MTIYDWMTILVAAGWLGAALLVWALIVKRVIIGVQRAWNRRRAARAFRKAVLR